MENTASILAIDDDRFSLKIIRRTLESADYMVQTAEDGEAGVELALSEQPDAILLDVEMPGMNGYETCEKLKENPDTASIPVVFLSSHSDLRNRMLGYEAGAADYLVKPFERDDLLAKIRILLGFIETQRALQKHFQDAQKTAQLALAGCSEMGSAVQFIEGSHSLRDFSSLANALLNALQQHELDCALMVLSDDEVLWFSSGGVVSPLEREMLSMADRQQRFADFGSRTIVNYPNLSLLVKSMPLDDRDRYGRIKDLLPIFLSAVDVKINVIKAEQATAEQSEDVLTAFSVVRNGLYHLAKTLMQNHQQSTLTLEHMVTELNTDFLRMGLEEDQEAYLLHQLDTAIGDVSGKLDNRDMLYSVFSDVFCNLKLIAEKQQELHKVFVDINNTCIAEDTGSDDSIELF